MPSYTCHRRASAPWSCMIHQGDSMGTSLQVTSQTEGVTAWGNRTHYGVQGKSIMRLFKIYYGIFSGRNEGRERESSRWFGKEEGYHKDHQVQLLSLPQTTSQLTPCRRPLPSRFLHISPTLLISDTIFAAKTTGQSLRHPSTCSMGLSPAPRPARPVPTMPSTPAAAPSLLTSCRSNEHPRATGSPPNRKGGKSRPLSYESLRRTVSL